MSNEVKQLIRKKALGIGFEDVRFISTEPLIKSEKNFLAWREKGFAADMNYLLKENPINARPGNLLENAKTIIMFTANYFTPCPPRPGKDYGRIASYAVGLDYHKVLKDKLNLLLLDPEVKNIFTKTKIFTDAVPLLEKSFAIKAGLGFRGRNTLLISRESGSFNFILEIITDIEFEPDAELSYAITCGSCTRCLDICPTGALPEPYQLDARKCISYHTIENRGEIPKELAKNFGEWFFGCDLCQEICPYNKKASRNGFIQPRFTEFSPQAGFGHWFYLPEILELEPGKHKNKDHLIESLSKQKFLNSQDFANLVKHIKSQNDLDEKLYDHIFQVKFARTALLRPKRKGLIRNASIVIQSSNKLASK